MAWESPLAIIGPEEHARLVPLTRDFGDVWSFSFEDWWNEPVTGDLLEEGEIRGEYLFAEPTVAAEVKRLTKAEAREFIESWDQQRYMLLAVPIHQYSEDFRRASSDLFRQRFQLKGLTRDASYARYPFTARINIEAIAFALALYDRAAANPELELWVHAMQLDPAYEGVSPADLAGARHLTERQELSQKGSRAKRRAEAMISAVEHGQFPDRTRSDGDQ